MAVLFLSVTAVSAQDATTKSKKEVKKELGQKLKKDGTVDKRYKQADAKVKEVKALPEKAKAKAETYGGEKYENIAFRFNMQGKLETEKPIPEYIIKQIISAWKAYENQKMD